MLVVERYKKNACLCQLLRHSFPVPRLQQSHGVLAMVIEHRVFIDYNPKYLLKYFADDFETWYVLFSRRRHYNKIKLSSILHVSFNVEYFRMFSSKAKVVI